MVKMRRLSLIRILCITLSIALINAMAFVTSVRCSVTDVPLEALGRQLTILAGEVLEPIPMPSKALELPPEYVFEQYGNYSFDLASDPIIKQLAHILTKTFTAATGIEVYKFSDDEFMRGERASIVSVSADDWNKPLQIITIAWGSIYKSKKEGETLLLGSGILVALLECLFHSPDKVLAYFNSVKMKNVSQQQAWDRFIRLFMQEASEIINKHKISQPLAICTPVKTLQLLKKTFTVLPSGGVTVLLNTDLIIKQLADSFYQILNQLILPKRVTGISEEAFASGEVWKNQIVLESWNNKISQIPHLWKMTIGYEDAKNAEQLFACLLYHLSTDKPDGFVEMLGKLRMESFELQKTWGPFIRTFMQRACELIDKQKSTS